MSELPTTPENQKVPGDQVSSTKIKYRQRRQGLYEVYYDGKGSVPKSLTGCYTSPTEAQRAIDNYLLTKQKPKRTKNVNRKKHFEKTGEKVAPSKDQS